MEKKIKKSDLSITVILIVGIILVLNFFSYQMFFRLDLTQDKIYSISDVSKNSVGDIEDIVNIKAYFSENLPGELLSLRQEVEDILDEYQAYSNGKIKIEFIDPNEDEKMQQELYMIGIPQLTFEVFEKDKRQLVKGYLGIAINFGDKTEVIPAIKRDTRDLEYQLTTAIKKVVSEEIATVGILKSQGTANFNETASAANEKIKELYTVVDVELTEEKKEIPSNVNTLIIPGPTEKFSEENLQAINSFLVKGGSALVLIDGVTVGEGLMASKNETGLDTLLEKYGIKVNQDLVADSQSGMASFSQGFITFSTQYPFWPMVNSDGFNSDNSAVANLESAVFPWASSISIDEQSINEETKITALAKTTSKSWRVKDSFNISPNGKITPSAEKGPLNVAVFLDGKIKNAYAEEGEEQTFNSRLVVVGDSDFAMDNFMRNNPDNLTLFQNLVDILSLDDDLINIRSKGASSRPIKQDITDGAKAAIRYFNVFGITLVVVLFGMIRYYMRRRSRFADDL